MASENETVADIVSKVRSGDYGCAKCGDLCDCPNADKIIASIVDRIEAAHGREVAELRECLAEAVHERCEKMCTPTALMTKNEIIRNFCDKECRYRKWRKALEGTSHECK